MSTIKAINLQHPSSTNTNIVLDSSGNMTVAGTVVGGSSMGMRNRIINGNFDVWQRGTSFVSPSSNNYVSDRWCMFTVPSASTISQQAFTPGQTAVPNNPTYFMRMASQSTSGQCRLVQKIEAPNAFSGQTFTLSFWAKTPDTATFYAYLTQEAFASGARTDTALTSVSPPVSLTSSWQKFTYTGTFPSVTGKTLNASTYASIEIYMPASTVCTMDIAQVQLEEGTVATPFERRQYGHELALCQRYYQTGTAAVEYTSIGGTSNYVQTIPFAVTMRSAPTVTYTNNAGGTSTSILASYTNAFAAKFASISGDNYWNFNYYATIEL